MQEARFEPLRALVAELAADDGRPTTARLFAPPDDSQGLEARVFPLGVRVRAENLDQLIARVRAVVAGDATGEPVPDTLGVCVHGKHDACCAKLGQGLAGALRAASDRSRLEVVETTHLGGHRFAATALHLVRGGPARMYGQLSADDAGTLLDHLNSGAVWLDRYRGRCDLGPAGQLAEGRALAAGARGPVEVFERGDARWEALWDGGGVTIRVEAQPMEGIKACGGDRERWERLRVVGG